MRYKCRRQESKMIERFKKREVTDVDISIKYTGRISRNYQSQFSIEASEIQREIGIIKTSQHPYRLINEFGKEGNNCFYGICARNRAEHLKKILEEEDICAEITRDDTRKVREFQYGK